MIRIRNLELFYKDRKIIHGLTFDVNDGELVVIRGKSGSGKTSLMNVIALLSKNYNGYIEVDSVDIRDISTKMRINYLQEKYSLIFQNYALVKDISLLENITFCLDRKVSVQQVTQTLHSLNVFESVNKNVYQLSGGQQQRVAIARAILKDTPYIFADEPTGNLDAKNTEEILSIFLELKKQGKTLILISHNDVFLDIADKIIDLDDYQIL